MSNLFIRRPVATMLVAVGVFLAGMVALVRLPVSPMPSIDIPTILVSAKLPGADPQTIAATVAAPLERRLSEIAGVTELTSNSTSGSTSIVVQFDQGRDVVGAAHDVQAAINAAASDLASDLPNPPTYRKINPSDAPIMILALTSDTLPAGALYDAADAILAQRLSQIDGVGQVSVNGAEKPAIRIRVNPAVVAAMGLGLEDVREAVIAANVTQPEGSFDGERQAMTIGSNARLFTAAGFAPLILRTNDGAVVRLSAVASVVDGVENARRAGWFNRDRAVLLVITKQTGANIVETVDQINQALPQLERWLPAGVKLSVLTDRTGNIRGTLHDVEYTLALTIVLVVLVVYLSLGRMTPTLAASITVPLSLASTFAAMWLLDYSLNLISLMGVIISVGFVVDDAIVMIENIARHIEKGDPPLTAATRGVGEIGFTVVSITGSLVAVFIPLLFMTGIMGQMFRQFAVTLTVAIIASAVVSLTVTPMVYGHLMLRRRHHPPSWVARRGEAAMSGLTRVYERGLGWVLRHQGAMLIVTAMTVVVTVGLYVAVPKGFFPPQDTGILLGNSEGRIDISFQVMAERQRKVIDVILSDPAVAGIGSFVGGSGMSSAAQARMFVNLKPIEDRKISAEAVINRLRPKLAALDGVSVFLMPGQDVRVGGRSSKATFQYTLTSDSVDDLRAWLPKLLERLKSVPGIEDLSSDQDQVMPQASVMVDRVAAARLGVSMKSVDQVLQDAFAQRQISTIYTQRNEYHVVLEVDPRHQEGPAGLHHLYVAKEDGGQVPLDAIAHYEMTQDPPSVNHQGLFPAATISFNLSGGRSLGEAGDLIAEAENAIGLPANIHGGFAGSAQAFAQISRQQPLLIAAAFLAIYIVLGILYESTIHPITIISTLPSAGIGALLAMMVTGTELTLISMIGIILLMGIVKKNGIMLVDFAIVAERQGHSSLRAIRAACRQRFRPITMTTLTALLGAVPLAVSSSASGALRQPLGIAIVGGLIVSQFLTLYTTPVVYLALARLSRRLARKRAVVSPEACP